MTTALQQPYLSQLDVGRAEAGDNITQLDGTLHLVLLQLACIWTKGMKTAAAAAAAVSSSSSQQQPTDTLHSASAGLQKRSGSSSSDTQ
jgi:hypothetical protein